MTNKEVELGFKKGGRSRKTAIELTIKKYKELPKHWKVLKGSCYMRDSNISEHYPCGGKLSSLCFLFPLLRHLPVKRLYGFRLYFSCCLDFH